MANTMQSSSPDKSKDRKAYTKIDKVSAFKSADYQSAVLIFLGDLIQFEDLISYRKVCKLFHDYAEAYETRLMHTFLHFKKVNAEAALAHSQHINEVRLLTDAKGIAKQSVAYEEAEEIERVKQKYRKKAAKIDNEHDPVIAERKNEYERIENEKKSDAKTIEASNAFYEKHLKLLEDFQKLLNEELQKKSWWYKRVTYSRTFDEDLDMNIIVYWFLVLMMTAATEFSLEAIIMSTALVIATCHGASIAAQNALLLSFLSPAGILIPMAIALGIVLIAHFNFDIRPVKDRLENDALSSISNDLEGKLNVIKKLNDRKFLPAAIQLHGNPFYEMNSNSELKQIYNAIENRITFFEGEREKISENNKPNISAQISP